MTTLALLCMSIYLFIGLVISIMLWSSLVIAKKSDINLGLDN